MATVPRLNVQKVVREMQVNARRLQHGRRRVNNETAIDEDAGQSGATEGHDVLSFMPGIPIAEKHHSHVPGRNES